MYELELRVGVAGGDRHLECVDHERVAHVPGGLPADDHPAVDVEDEREIEDALEAAQ
jgi:hypothetical protein